VTMPVLEITGLSKRFGEVQALSNVSFSVEAGEILGYLGPNGAGKTTTLRAILRLVHADAGVVRLFGDSTHRAAIRRNVGYLPGELRLYGEMTARSLLDYFARYRPDRPPVLREILLKSFEVDDGTLSRKVKFLSQGTKQKLGLIIAMQHDPELLLLDEPTLGLDPLVQHTFQEMLSHFAQRGRAILLSSHILSEVEALCDRVAILRSGEIVSIESVESLRQKMVRRLEIRVRGSIPAGLIRAAGVVRSSVSGNEALLWLQGDVNPILRCLAGLEVEKFVFPAPALEDIFLSYYQPPKEIHV